MLSLQAVQNKLLVETLPSCNKAVLQATTLSDVENSVRLLVEQVHGLGFLDLVLVPKKNHDPQDLTKEEERKGEPSLTKQVTDECQKFEEAQKIVKESLETEAKQIAETKQEI